MARHSSLAEQLRALKDFTQRPEALEPMETNWSTVAANDNNPEDTVDLHVERRVAIRPTLQEIARQLENGAIVRGPDVFSEIFQRMIPGPVVSIGNLRFSDGRQFERCMVAGIDGKVSEGTMRMPVGALLGAKEEQERVLGGSSLGKGEGNAYFAAVLDVDNRQYMRGGKRRSGRNFTRSEAVKMLADAIVNTPAMPSITHCEDGFALGAARVADNFLGMKKMSKGSGGSIAWQDMSDKIAEREAWIAAEQSLSKEDAAVLEAATEAKNMIDVAAPLRPMSKRGAQRKGRRALLAANDNLAAAIEKYVA